MARLPALLVLCLSLSACVGVPLGPMGPGGATPVAMTSGPVGAGLPMPRPGQPMSAEDCAAYLGMARSMGMMTPQVESQFAQAGC